MQPALHVRDADEAAALQWTSASCSHPGSVRSLNEDSCLEQPERGLWAVADGMGGHSLGEYASRLAVRCLLDLPWGNSIAERVRAVEQRLQDANRRLRDEADRRDVRVIGTTIAALVAFGHHCACVWAGDSRIYLFRDGRLRQLTRDHSQLEAVRARHTPSSDDTLHRPPSNWITRALGGSDAIELESATFEVLDGDLFLLCSDGLSNELTDLYLTEGLLPGHCRLASEALVDNALARGGRDNITAVVVRADDLGSPERTVVMHKKA